MNCLLFFKNKLSPLVVPGKMAPVVCLFLLLPSFLICQELVNSDREKEAAFGDIDKQRSFSHHYENSRFTHAEDSVLHGQASVTTTTHHKPNNEFLIDQIIKQIERKQKILNNARKKYYNLHELLEGYVKIEATKKQLNIDHYQCKADRFKPDKKDVQLNASTSFPDNLGNWERERDIKLLVAAYKGALVRYKNASSVDFAQTGAMLTIILYNGSGQLEQSIYDEMIGLGVPFYIDKRPSKKTSVSIYLLSNSFFKNELKKWEGFEQRIARDIRVLQLQLDQQKNNVGDK